MTFERAGRLCREDDALELGVVFEDRDGLVQPLELLIARPRRFLIGEVHAFDPDGRLKFSEVLMQLLH